MSLVQRQAGKMTGSFYSQWRAQSVPAQVCEPVGDTPPELLMQFIWQYQRLFGIPRRLATAAAQQGLIQITRDYCDHAPTTCENCHFPDLMRSL